MKMLGYNISTKYPKLPVQAKTIISTINPHSYCVASKDKIFHEALKQSDYLFPDGIGIVLAAKVLNRRKINKIAGYDIFIYLMKYLNQIEGKCFFLGASPQTLTIIKARAALDFPKVKVVSFSPAYKIDFSEYENIEMRTKINEIRPDVLFVGMTAPKQEKWVYSQKQNLNVNIICSIGAVFDFYAGNVQRPSQFWIDIGLEWFPRFIKEPKRLWRRNLISTPQFIFEVLRAKFSQ
ncbi:WecB/TagA/CpsF family glycosyltransferase [Algoriphagus marinus]|uniref:WecB/TagA/CpsF family glycosyltransferase n=1 Tax=Algoriphagus marinus TaxID=1925762 RepID=UPI00094B7F2F|nr:WecB/TagA/CpsF family glycosyltransferase [Algoriphagus marinus]